MCEEDADPQAQLSTCHELHADTADSRASCSEGEADRSINTRSAHAEDQHGCSPVIHGRHLRYLLVIILDRTRVAMTLAQLHKALQMAGFEVRGNGGKVVSDSLRWAVDHGQVVRVERGVYRASQITKQTRHRYHRRVAAFSAVADLSNGPGVGRHHF